MFHNLSNKQLDEIYNNSEKLINKLVNVHHNNELSYEEINSIIYYLTFLKNEVRLEKKSWSRGVI